MNITHEEVAENSVEITLVLEPEDYKPTLHTELKKIRKDAHLKGFRKGAAPIGFIKKLYGQKILEDAIPNLAMEKLNAYAEEKELTFFFDNPIMLSPPVRIDVKDEKNYEFKYEVGITNVFKSSVFEEDNEKAFPFYEVEISEEDIDERVTSIQEEHAGPEDMESITAESDDFIGVLYELNDDLSVKDLKDSTYNAYCFVKPHQFKEEVLEQLMDKPMGTAVDFNLTNVFKSELINEDYIKSYLLFLHQEDASFVEENDDATVYKVHEPESYESFDAIQEAKKEELAENPEEETSAEEAGPKVVSRKFRLEISRITKNILPELDEEFFSTIQVEDEADLRKRIKDSLDQQTSIINIQHFYKQVQKDAQEESGIVLPEHYAETFFKDVNKSYLENQIEKRGVSMEELMQEEDIQENLEKFKEGLLVNALDNKFADKLELEASEEEMRQQLMYDVDQAYKQNQRRGWISPDMKMDDFIKHYLNNPSSVQRAHQSIMKRKAINATSEKVKKEHTNIDLKSFLDITNNESL